MEISVKLEAIYLMATELENIKRQYDQLFSDLVFVRSQLDPDIAETAAVSDEMQQIEKKMSQLNLLLKNHAKYLWDARNEYTRAEKQVLRICDQIIEGDSGNCIMNVSNLSYSTSNEQVKNLSLINTDMLVTSIELPSLKDIGIQSVTADFISDEFVVVDQWILTQINDTNE